MSMRDDLKAFVDGELPAMRMAEIREAIERDPELAKELGELQRITTAIRGNAEDFQPVGLEQTLAALKRTRKRSWVWLAWPLGLAGAAALAFVTIMPRGGQAFAKNPVGSPATTEASAERLRDSVALNTPSSEEKEKSTALQRTPLGPAVAKAAPLTSEWHERAAEGAKSTGGKTERYDFSRTYKTGEKPIRGQTNPIASSSPDSPIHPMDRNKTALSDLTGEKKSDSSGLVALNPKSRDGMSSPVIDKPDVGSTSLGVVTSNVYAPVVLEVDSVEEAQSRVANLAGHFDGYAKADVTLKQGAKAEREIVLEVPTAKAAEALEVIRNVVTSPMRKPQKQTLAFQNMATFGATVKGDPIKPSQDQNVGQTNGAQLRGGFGGRGGGAGGIGGGGNAGGAFGGGRPGEGPGGSGVGRGAPGGRGGSANAEAMKASSGAAKISNSAPATLDLDGRTGKSIHRYTGPTQRIVIVLRKRAPKSDAKQAQPAGKTTRGSSTTGNL